MGNLVIFLKRIDGMFSFYPELIFCYLNQIKIQINDSSDQRSDSRGKKENVAASSKLNFQGRISRLGYGTTKDLCKR